jgi:hypothetical protein
MKSATHGARLSALTSRQQDKLATDICKLNRSRQARHVYAEFVRLVDEELGYYRILRHGYGALGPAAKELKQFIAVRLSAGCFAS